MTTRWGVRGVAGRESFETRSAIIRNAVAYIVILTACGLIIWFAIAIGTALQNPAALTNTLGPQRIAAARITNNLHNNLRSPLGILLTQIVLIVLAARVLSHFASKLRQPRVVGEMVAGILLGPSLLGLLSPAAVGFLFPPSSMDTLKMFSELGAILFMFRVGMDFDVQHLLKHAHTAILVSHASIIVPFTLGTALSLFIYRSMAGASASFSAFALFMGVAMSITAFPVLARIVHERGWTECHLGIVSIGCAAVDDISAWCILGVVLSFVKADGIAASVFTMALVLVYVALMVFLLKPFLRWLLPAHTSSSNHAITSHYNSWAAVVIAFGLSASLATEIIGMHALFGAFLAGIIIPPGDLRSFCKERFEVIMSGLLLPLFFAFTGLRTQITLLNNPNTWLICTGVIAIAVAGKLGGSMIAARCSGMQWNESFLLGVLMNTRGLMELIVINIGYDLGIMSSQMFAILVLMALLTTGMTAPLLGYRTMTTSVLPNALREEVIQTGS